MKSNTDKSPDNNKRKSKSKDRSTSKGKPITKVDAGRQHANPLDYDHPYGSLVAIGHSMEDRH